MDTLNAEVCGCLILMRRDSSCRGAKEATTTIATNLGGEEQSAVVIRASAV